MPKPRIIDPSFWEDLDIIALTRDERLLLVGIFTSGADDVGLSKANAPYLKRLAFAFDADISIDDVERMAVHIGETCRNIKFYHDHGERYLAIRNWDKYQAIKYARKTSLPLPPWAIGEDIWPEFANFGQDAPKFPKASTGSVGLGSAELSRVELGGAAVGLAQQKPDKNNGGGSPLPDRDEYGPTNEPGGPTQMTSEEQKAVAKMWQDKMGSLCPPKILMYIGPEMRKYDGIHGHSALEWGLTVLEEAIASTTNPMGPNEKYMSAIFANWNLNGWRAPPGQRESKRDEIAETREKAKATRQQMLAQGVPRAEVDATIVEFYGEGY